MSIDTITFHIIGKYDSACEIMMLIRLKEVIPAIREIAEQIIKHDPEQCHAKWVLSNIQEHTKRVENIINVSTDGSSK